MINLLFSQSTTETVHSLVQIVILTDFFHLLQQHFFLSTHMLISQGLTVAVKVI